MPNSYNTFQGCAEGFTIYCYEDTRPYQFAWSNHHTYVLLPRGLELPLSLTRIESGAFSGIEAEVICIPAGVTYIADDAFPAGATLVVAPGSYAEDWAKAHGFVWEN